MKILITGGLGFLGSALARRFYKEGHSVFLLDDLSSGKPGNVRVPHRLYRMSVTDGACEMVFRANRFDAVVHLADVRGKKRAVSERTDREQNENFSGLIRMLELCARYNVPRFLFASSADVYGPAAGAVREDAALQPRTALGFEKQIAEYCCEAWGKQYGLRVVILRFGDIYGPGQQPDSAGDRLLHEPESENAGAAKGCGFLYVDDVADAFYRAAETDAEGVFNLSCEEPEAPPADESLFLNHEKATLVLHWKPIYDLRQGLQKTGEWEKRGGHFSAKASVPKKKSGLRAIAGRALPYVENAAVFAAILLLNRYGLRGGGDTFFAYAGICYVYICAFAVLYGMRQAFLSVAFSAAVYLSVAFWSGENLISVFYQPASVVNLGGYVAVGIMMGYFADVTRRRRMIEKMEMKSLREKYDFLESMFDETRESKQELEGQIIGYKGSFASIYETTRALDSLKLEKVYSASVQVVERLMNTDQVSLYVFNRDKTYLRLKAKSASPDLHLPYSVGADRFPELKDAVENQTVFINREMKEGLPLLAVPVVDRGRVEAVLSIYRTGFRNLTLYYANLFRVLASLIASAIHKANQYDQATAAKKYLPNTEILVPEEFRSALEQKKRSLEQCGIAFTLLRIDGENDCGSLSERISTSIRDDDIIGMGPDRHVYTILSNTERSQAGGILERLGAQGVCAHVAEAVEVP